MLKADRHSLRRVIQIRNEFLDIVYFACQILCNRNLFNLFTFCVYTLQRKDHALLSSKFNHTHSSFSVKVHITQKIKSIGYFVA